MSFYERWFNTIVSTYDWAVRKFSYLPTVDEHARKYFSHLEPLPSIDDILRNVSMVFSNTHRALSPPRPSMPSKIFYKMKIHWFSQKFKFFQFCFFFNFSDVINIGGAHIKPTKPLPQDIQEFLDKAKHGVIYFSIGSILQSSKLPKDKLTAFIGEFEFQISL